MKNTFEGMSVLLTGATGGIGQAAAAALSERGATLLLHARDPSKLERLAADLSSRGARVETFAADLASLADTTGLARRIVSRGGVDVLINNAGVGFGKDGHRREKSRDGFELRFAVNYLAPFLLSEELLAQGSPRRALLNVASAGQEELDFSDLMTERGYSGVRAYCRSKLALIMATLSGASLHPRVQFLSLHPGTYLDTGMVREAGITPLGPASRGGESVVGLLETALRGGESGRYFDQSRPSRARSQAYDEKVRARLREASLQLVAPFRSKGRE